MVLVFLITYNLKYNKNMKKFCSFLLFVLLAGGLSAVENATYVFTSKSWTATLNGVAANWTSGKDGSGFSNNGIQVTSNAASTGANATSPVSFDNITKIVITYNTNQSAGTGTFEVQIGDDEAVSAVCKYSGKKNGTTANFTTVFDYAEPQSGKVKLTTNVTTNSIYVVSIAITYGYNASAPDIMANKLDIGTHLIPRGQTSVAIDTTLHVSGVNLIENILVSCPNHVTATESSLPAAGGALHLQFVADSPFQLEDSIVLTSGETSIKVPVAGVFKQNPALTGIDATVTKGENASNVIMDGVDAFKIGTSNAGGSVIITVPAATNRLRFYAVAWNNEAGTLSLSTSPAADLGVESLTLLADAGLVGNSPFSMSVLTPAAYVHEIAFEPLAKETQITLTSNTARRFFIWDVKYELGEPVVPEPEPVTDYTINYLAKDQSVLSTEILTFNLPEAPAIEGFTFLYWQVKEGKISDGINIQAVYESKLPSGAPAEVVNPANPAQKLIRNGNVYILSDGVEYNILGSRL